MQPPTIAKGQNLGQRNIRLATKATDHMAAQSTHWRNMPGNERNWLSVVQTDLSKLTLLGNISEMVL